MAAAYDDTPLPAILTDAVWTVEFEFYGADEGAPLPFAPGSLFDLTLAPKGRRRPDASEVHTLSSVGGEITFADNLITVTADPRPEGLDVSPGDYLVELRDVTDPDAPVALYVGEAAAPQGLSLRAAEGGGGPMPGGEGGGVQIFRDADVVRVVRGDGAGSAAQAAASATAAAAAAARTGPTFATFALADADLASIAANAYVTVVADETRDGHRTFYRKVDGALVFLLDFDLGRRVYLETFGALGDGDPETGAGTDDSAALNLALVALQAAGGGILELQRRTYRVSGDFTFPTDGAPNSNGVPAVAPIRITGYGGHESGQQSPPVGGSILMWTGANTANPRLQTHGQGILELDRFTLLTRETGTGRPFFHTSNTTPKISQVCCFAFKAQGACDDDGFILGGQSVTFGETLDAPYQGYIASIRDNFFQGIREAVVVGVYANACRIENNFIGHRCGSSKTVGDRCAFRVRGDTSPTPSSQWAVGTVFIGNPVEIGQAYDYGFILDHAEFALLAGNDVYDAAAQAIAGVYVASNCIGVQVHASLPPTGKPYLYDPGGVATIISSEQGTYTRFPSLAAGAAGYPNLFGPTTFRGGSGSLHIQPAVGNFDSGKQLTLLRSAASTSGAGVEVISLQGDGRININPSADTSVTNVSLVVGGAGNASFLAGFKQWVANGAGGNMIINSGTGGSALTLQNNQVLWRDQTGALQAKFSSAANASAGIGFDLGPTGDVSFYRRSASQFETNVAFRVGNYTVATLPTPVATMKGAKAFATNGRRAAEGSGAGTGIPVWCTGTDWRTYYDNAVATA